MADEKPYKKFKVADVRYLEIQDSRTGAFVGPGGVVELWPMDDKERPLPGQVNVEAMMASGFIEEVPEDAPAPAPASGKAPKA